MEVNRREARQADPGEVHAVGEAAMDGRIGGVVPQQAQGNDEIDGGGDARGGPRGESGEDAADRPKGHDQKNEKRGDVLHS